MFLKRKVAIFSLISEYFDQCLILEFNLKLILKQLALLSLIFHISLIYLCAYNNTVLLKIEVLLQLVLLLQNQIGLYS